MKLNEVGEEVTRSEVFHPGVDYKYLGLEIQDGDEFRTVPVGERALTIGSSRTCDVVIADKAVSGRHCEVAVSRGGMRLRDLASKNGTFCGASRIEVALAVPGTIFTIGNSTITCVDLAIASAAKGSADGVFAAIPGMAGRSRAMRDLAAQVARVAPLSVPVLISGETGTGKELIAHALHALSVRRERAYVPINVANLPRDLVESELFGHERGAFTGAVARKLGAFEEAAGGTIFLDEIGELPMDAQPKLLRVLDGYDVRRVGGQNVRVRTDARVIAATHVDLEHRINEGRFRRDLFHRLEVFVITIPPLRDRREDILPMAKAFLRNARAEIGERTLTSSAASLLCTLDLPGNARELRNVLYRAADAAHGSAMLDTQHINDAVRRPKVLSLALTPAMAREMYASCNENVSAAARMAGCPRSTFRKLLSQSA
jgi:transcriptional regulator with GAF, ATPase, and Fis domain